ncbi:Membrane associated serine protease, rhomboid family [Actinomyces ruminicola]|uniref:Membrane associated serine protease, rhomboid family n=1 Tax=Actinomyces ruminicola TaxID=332524 RepID=A0A1H0AP46_9ACTO|nr:rhomboid family intramembrane serine protease [Actinomyces ruminicola]SDN35145.1 Membrane associated serine protease, rhomboid family [Actinomyces ruminicola]
MTQPDPRVGTAPVCPRHPDRVAYVRCQRCGRPTCPECQVPSAVGIHCVDCARSASSRRRGVRTALGGNVVADALVTKLLVGTCVVVYAVQMVYPALAGWFDFVPALAAGQPWRFLSTALLHASLLHLALNMWALWVLGNSLEPLLGRWRFTALTALSALGGSTAIYWLAAPTSPSWITGTVGASGAIFGLFAAVFVIQRRFGRDTSTIVGLLVINLVISVVGANISWQGHLGGFITGLLVSAIYAWAPRERRTAVGVWGTVGVAVALVGLAVARALLV